MKGDEKGLMFPRHEEEGILWYKAEEGSKVAPNNQIDVEEMSLASARKRKQAVKPVVKQDEVVKTRRIWYPS